MWRGLVSFYGLMIKKLRSDVGSLFQHVEAKRQKKGDLRSFSLYVIARRARRCNV